MSFLLPGTEATRKPHLIRTTLTRMDLLNIYNNLVEKLVEMGHLRTRSRATVLTILWQGTWSFSIIFLRRLSVCTFGDVRHTHNNDAEILVLTCYVADLWRTSGFTELLVSSERVCCA